MLKILLGIMYLHITLPYRSHTPLHENLKSRALYNKFNCDISLADAMNPH